MCSLLPPISLNGSVDLLMYPTFSCADIAVGAPYEDNGQGAVYIFHGHPEITNLKMAERIAARQFNPLFSSSQILLGFGSSISTGNDIDNNGTPGFLNH